MNKYLLMSAAAAMATGVTGTANAAGYSVHFLGASGTSYCDGYIGGTNSSGAAGGSHYYQVCASLGYTYLKNIHVVGVKAGGTPPGKKAKSQLVFSDTTYAMEYIDLNEPTYAWSYAISFVLQSPIKAGKKWALWVSFANSSASLGNEGTLASGQYAKTRPGKAVKSTSVVDAILRQAHLVAPK